MKGRSHTPEQIVRKLRKADRLLAAGKGVAEVAKELVISEHTVGRWRNQYGGMKADDAKELRRLKDENGRLKRMVADQALDIQILKGAGKILSTARRRDAVRHVCQRLGVSERRACRAIGQSRTTQRRPAPPVLAPEQQLRFRLHEISRDWPRYGYRFAHELLHRKG